ncbi:hypothetical protein PA598K_01061 [Paenibacillus sp. 598K]|uniref:DUF1405 domain-containing protein n=1 Tax=Paenibacillus sp. 598K TaxID=1117987 RepID=UPI000FF98710|nr:DUF1405 domain-containing protein [Paenibacillus sp. 598K]GBF72793.1 hypothetical protein PA598K_01061 [Paenibacillus sp. 598K]
MSISFFWSRALLTSRPFLWLIFIVNLLGTIYGYMWYGNQLVYTAANHPLWQLVFVPDSPTASLFFTIALLYLLYPPKRPSRLARGLRMLIEALAVATSVKYGVWAVAMIFAGYAQGNALGWQDWMLVLSHLGMAFEALLYVRFMTFGRVALLAAGGWLLLNDTLDYTYGIFPWLPKVLQDDLPAIQMFTIGLSIASILLAWIFLLIAHRSRAGGTPTQSLS